MSGYPDERAELTGNLITIEFGEGGRIQSLWATDPALPEEGEEFQFILPPLPMGEENAENLFPGTILLSARLSPAEPWISSRNNTAHPQFQLDEDELPKAELAFDYDFPLLPELQVTGKFSEITQPFPQIVWEVEVVNSGNKSIEIGEVGFPLAFNTFYDGFGWNDEQLSKLWNSRLYTHKFIGGAASWVFAQRMTGEPPGLLVFPGDDKGWEFFCSIPSSLNTPHQWEGIPVVYAYSKATIEREGWQKWWNDHTSLILEPGDRRTFVIKFVPADRDRVDGIAATLAACGRPAIRLLPGAVAPVEVGIGIEVQGVKTKRFHVSRDAEIETDTEDENGFCFVRPREPGRVRVSFEDSQGRLSHVHLMFTEGIESLIKRRAEYIVEQQLVDDEAIPLHKSFTMVNVDTGEKIIDPDEYAANGGIECSLADALYLAEKNVLYPLKEQIKVLDGYIQDFLLDDVQNPGDMSVGSVLMTANSFGSYAGRPLTYPSVFCLYHAMYRIAKFYGETALKPEEYLRMAAQTGLAMFTFGWRNYIKSVGVLGFARIYKILDDLETEGLTDEHDRLRECVEDKAEEILKLKFPYAGETVLDTSGFEEVFRAALHLNDDEHIERTMRCAFAARSLAPSWWWYGSDRRNWDGIEVSSFKALADRGEACMAHTTIPNALVFFGYLDRDYLALPEVYMRVAFGGMLGPWALIRKDGAASLCYCPDSSSKHFGYNRYSGASGLGYFHYLREVGSYVLPNGAMGTFVFGCHFDSDGGCYTVKPWDGVGRRIVLRQIGVEIDISFGKIVFVRLDHRKRWIEIKIENQSDKNVNCELFIKGMWGAQMHVLGRLVDSVDGLMTVPLLLAAHQVTEVQAKVMN